MSEHEDQRERYFLALLKMGLPPSEVDRLTINQFDIACRWIDEGGGPS